MQATADNRFTTFVGEHTPAFRAYLSSALRASRVEVDDAFQHGLLRIWREFDGWPADPGEQRAYAIQALRYAAKDALRSASAAGRAAQLPVDFAALEATSAEHNDLQREVHAALARRASERDPRDDDTSRALEDEVIVAAMAALSPEEQEVLWLSGDGFDDKEIAAQLQISHQAARTLKMQARGLLRGLIDHAQGVSTISDDERAQLWAYLDGDLCGRDKRAARRHYAACAACRELAEVERGALARGARVWLPLPLLFGGTAKASAATAGAAAAVAVAASGGGGGGGASAFGGLGAKAAVGLVALALAGAGAGVATIDGAASGTPPASAEVQPTTDPNPADPVPARPTAARDRAAQSNPPKSRRGKRNRLSETSTRSAVPPRRPTASHSPAPAPTSAPSPEAGVIPAEQPPAAHELDSTSFTNEFSP
jgi:RNA polymerase sigma factor (sigma-70 family)